MLIIYITILLMYCIQFKISMNSKSKNPSKLTIQNYKEHLASWKEPYIHKIKQAANQFHEKVQQAYEKQLSVKNYEQQQQLSQQTLKKSTIEQDNYLKCGSPKNMEGQKRGKDRVVFNQMPQQIINLQEWKPDPESSFKDYDEIAKNYHDIFQKKQKLKNKGRNEKVRDFREDQWQLVNQIYNQIREQDSTNVCFEAIISFFESCQLFYYFYNIHPYRLSNLVQEYAKKYQDKLTKEQFFNLFLIDRPTLSQYQFKTQKNPQSVCILSKDRWKDIKAIFDNLDTFGNQEINIKNFFQKIRSSSNFGLLSSQALYFPQLKRKYTLQKILFDLENKYNFPQKVQWKQIQDLISNFTHITEPTLEQIYGKKISKAQITKDTNYFLLDPKILKILKNIFQHCPKYCNSFVKSSFYILQLLQSSALKNHYNNATRLDNSSKKQYLTLERVIKLLPKQAPEYFDLDEMLQYFSIKGPKKMTEIKFSPQEDSSSDDDIKLERQQRKLKKIKSLGDLKKGKKNKSLLKIKHFQGTKPKEFNLYKRQKETIRQKKVKEMIEEKQMMDEIQLAKKFKANSIPVALNPERYQKYAKSMQKKKISILNRLNLKREADTIVIEYLKANTKLFATKSKKQHCSLNSDTYKFQPKPIPAHNSEQLLEKIAQEKLERKKQIFEQTRKKYEQKYWKHLQLPEDQIEENNNDSLLEEIQLIGEEKPQRKVHQVPNFEYLHQKFAQQLKNRKKKIQPTQIREFNLTSPKKKYYEEKSPQYRFKSKSPPQNSPANPIKLTKKYEDWVSYNQARQAEKQIQLLEKEKQKEERLLKQRNFAKFMRGNLMNCTDNTTKLRQQTAIKLKNFQKYMKQLEKNTENELAQIYSRVLHRPFLFEEASETHQSLQKQGSQIPKKIRPSKGEDYEYKAGIFDKQSQQFHPIESQNLNQSF